MLELDDIQHFLMARPHAMVARYEFLSFKQPAAGRAWLAGIIEKVGIAGVVRAASETESRWVTGAFTWNGLRALGDDDDSLGRFPDEFRQGMVAGPAVLVDTVQNDP